MCRFSPPFAIFRNTPKARTNPVAACRSFLLIQRGQDAFRVPECDRRSVDVFASLKLTPREAEVLFWISRGKSNHDIGVILGAKTATIRKHVEHILAKLYVENRTAAAVVALETCRSVAPAPEEQCLVNLGLRSPVLSRPNSVRYGQMVTKFTAKSRISSREPIRLTSAFAITFWADVPGATEALLVQRCPSANCAKNFASCERTA